MTEPKFEIYLFTRAEGFYPVQITKESLLANIKHNPGTLSVQRVDDDGIHHVLWTESAGWVDTEYAQLFREH